ncbi:MAG: hypothetical protein RL466_490, partial [Actinomycetota bacterium]
FYAVKQALNDLRVETTTLRGIE